MEKNGKWKPYAEEDYGKKLIDVIVFAKRLIPRWMRVNRVQRDFPPSNEKNNFVGYVSNTIPTNLRQNVLKELSNYGLTCQCIHCREIKDIESDPTKAKMTVHKYEASEGVEYFISFNTHDLKYLYGFIRLRFNFNKTNGPFPQEDMALIRELHVYGNVEKVHQKMDNKAAQHMGFGKKLIQAAETIAWNNNYHHMAIISAVGTREYYKKFGYKLRGTYMVKELNNPHIWVDIIVYNFNDFG